MKKTVSIIIISMMTFLFLFSSCSTPLFKNNTTIKLMVNSTQAQLKMYKEITSAFETKYPEYKVMLLSTDPDMYEQRLLGSFKAHTEPDLFQTFDYFSNVSQNILIDLLPVISDDPDFQWDALMPGIRDLVDIDGSVYGLPINLDTKVIYVNLEKFKKIKMKLPYEGWDMQQFIKAVRLMTKQNMNDPDQSEFGYIFEPRLDGLLPFIWNSGADVLDRSKSIVFNVPEIRESIRVLVNMVILDRTIPDPDSIAKNGVLPQFLSGKIGLMYGDRKIIPQLIQEAKFEWDVLPIPGNQTLTSLMDGKIFSIPVKSRNRQGAWKLLKFLVLEEGASLQANYFDSIPVKRDIAYSSLFINSGETINNNVFLRSLENSRVHPLKKIEKGEELESMLNENILQMFNGKLDIDEGCKTIDTEAKTIQN